VAWRDKICDSACMCQAQTCSLGAVRLVGQRIGAQPLSICGSQVIRPGHTVITTISTSIRLQ
jgi:hypothetical protein